jgi:hypothetical protein
VSEVSTEFLETSAEFRVESVPLSHVSVEVGHLYMEDLAAGESAMQRTFAAAAPWIRAAREPQAIGCEKKSVRLSTCFLIDDYFGRFSTPAVVIPMVLAAAKREGLEIDYLARESACANAGGASPRSVSPASLTLGSLVTEPTPGTTGGRPPLTETGWLTNGQRSPSNARDEAMARRAPWQPPRESARRRHSIFVDVELWDDRDGQRTWSCAMLAAVWQLMRLGLLRDQGRAVVTPQDWPDPLFPDTWDDLPPIVRLNPRAAAFRAYTTLSVLSPRFLPVELAVRTILSQFACDPMVFAEATGRAARDAMPLPAELVERIRYVFAAPGETDPALFDPPVRVGRVPEQFEPLLQLVNPGRHRREQGAENAGPRLAHGQLRGRRGLVTEDPVEHDEVEDDGPHPLRNILVIEHPDLYADILLILGHPPERLITCDLGVLEHKDAPNADLPGDRLTLEVEITDTQVAGP